MENEIVRLTVRIPEKTAKKLRARVYKLKKQDPAMSENKLIVKAVENELAKEVK